MAARDAEIEAEFKRLEEELQAQIDADMREARQKLFDFLDRDVVARLRQRGNEIEVTLNAFEQRLLTVARAELPDARFHAPTGPRFDYDGRTWTTEWPLADETRLAVLPARRGDARRADRRMTARARQVPPTAITFDYGCLPAGRMAAAWQCRAAERAIRLAYRVSPERDAGRPVALASATGLSSPASATMPLRMPPSTSIRPPWTTCFLLPGTDAGAPGRRPADQTRPAGGRARAAVAADIEAENRRWLDEETEKLDAYADDIEQAADTQIKQMEAEIRAAKKALRGNTVITLEDKVKEQRRIKAMEGEADDLKLTTFQRRRAVRTEMDEKLDAIAQALKATPTSRRSSPPVDCRVMSRKQKLELTWVGKDEASASRATYPDRRPVTLLPRSNAAGWRHIRQLLIQGDNLWR